MIRLSCLHTHTEFCDGTGTVDDYCAAAAAKGFASIGFSAHAPVDHLGITSDWHLSAGSLDRYLEAVRRAKDAWRGTLQVFTGLEVDYIRGFSGPADSRWHSLGLDYIIGSLHCVLPDGAAPGWGGKLVCIDGSREDFVFLLEKGFNGDVQLLVERYYEDIIAMCAEGSFDLLGHADLIIKNNGASRFFSTESAYWTEAVTQLCDALSQTAIVVEVNTGGLNRGATNAPYPSLKILEMMRHRNVPVTINADAHHPRHLDGFYAEARAALIAAGYDEFLIPTRSDNGKLVWEHEPLIEKTAAL